MAAMVEDYLETGGPFPERMHLIAPTVEITTRLLADLETFCADAAAVVDGWDTTVDHGMTEDVRARLEAVLAMTRTNAATTSGR